MTLQELYQNIGGSYDQAIRVLRMEKLMDKHIRKFAQNGIVEALIEAGGTMDPADMFEKAHALKGVSGNLGLTGLYELACELSDEFRPGNARKHSDAEVAAKLGELEALYKKTTEGIRRYEETAG